MAAGATRRGADGRHILGVKRRGRTFKIKIRAALQQADATIPAENAVVIAGGANFLRLRKAAHGFFNQWQENVRGVADEQLRFGVALVQ